MTLRLMKLSFVNLIYKKPIVSIELLTWNEIVNNITNKAIVNNDPLVWVYIKHRDTCTNDQQSTHGQDISIVIIMYYLPPYSNLTVFSVSIIFVIMM
jgi:hypothetical protein